MQKQDRALEDWLTNEVAATYDAVKADPSTLRTGEQVLESLAAAYRSFQKAT